MQFALRTVKNARLKRRAPCAQTIPICMQMNAKAGVQMVGSTWERISQIENVYPANRAAVNVPIRPGAASARMVCSSQPMASVNLPVQTASSIFLGPTVLVACASFVQRTAPSVNGIGAWSARPPSISLTTSGAQRHAQLATLKMEKEKWGGCVSLVQTTAIPARTACIAPSAKTTAT